MDIRLASKKTIKLFQLWMVFAYFFISNQCRFGIMFKKIHEKGFGETEVGDKYRTIKYFVHFHLIVCFVCRFREEVRDMFQHAYNGYLKYASEYDELRPLT